MARIVETVTKEIEPDPWISDDEAEHLCCEPTDMPPCKEKVAPWHGYTRDEILEMLGIDVDEHGRDAAGNIIEVRTRNSHQDGICGEQVTKIRDRAKSCCDGVTETAWDEENSVEVIADNSSGYVYVTGGRPPYTWSVRGSGFWFNSTGTIRDAETDEPWIRIYTIDSCGSALVEVTDGCSSASEYVRSTVGQWNDQCVAYYWPGEIYVDVVNKTVSELTPSGCSWWTGATVLSFTGQAFPWSYYGNNWSNLVYRWTGGSWTIVGWNNFYIPKYSYQATVVARMTALSVPPRVYPSEYAPNGPGDAYHKMCPDEDCQFIC